MKLHHHRIWDQIWVNSASLYSNSWRWKSEFSPGTLMKSHLDPCIWNLKWYRIWFYYKSTCTEYFLGPWLFPQKQKTICRKSCMVGWLICKLVKTVHKKRVQPCEGSERWRKEYSLRFYARRLLHVFLLHFWKQWEDSVIMLASTLSHFWKQW